MHSLPLGKEILKMKNDFWGLISIIERDNWEYHIFKIHITNMCPLFMNEVFEIAPQGI